MSRLIEIEAAEPILGQRCECCGGLPVRLTGFVSVDGDARAVYYAAYTNGHPQQEVALLVSIGEWGGENPDPRTRVSFFAHLWPHDGGSYNLRLADADGCPWADVELLGTKLCRADALEHPFKEEFFAISDEIGKQGSIAGFFQRVECGDTAEPMERSFGAPDRIFALPESERARRVRLGRNLAVLDDERFFVRALLRMPVETYVFWSVGVWVEVQPSIYTRVAESWDDPKAYMNLRFEGTLANDLASLDLPGGVGTQVSIAAAAADEALRVVDSAEPALQRSLREPWRCADFEPWAVRRGLL